MRAGDWIQLLLLKLSRIFTLLDLASKLFVNRMNFVLAGWSASLWERKKSDTFLNSWLTFAIKFSRFVSERSRVVSSANSNAKSSEHSGKSLMYIKNSSGPKTEPCGTPMDKSLSKLLAPLTCTNCTDETE